MNFRYENNSLYGKLIKKATRTSNTAFYAHWFFTETDPHHETNYTLIQCKGCHYKVSNSQSFGYDCVIKCDTRFLNTLQGIKLRKTTQNSQVSTVAITPIHRHSI